MVLEKIVPIVVTLREEHPQWNLGNRGSKLVKRQEKRQEKCKSW